MKHSQTIDEMHNQVHGVRHSNQATNFVFTLTLYRYHSVDDSRLPNVFQCFSCRLRNDPQIEVLDSRNLTSEYITKFKDLSLFR